MLIIHISSYSTQFFYPSGMGIRRRFWPFGLERFIYEPRLKRQLETLCLAYKPAFLFLSKPALRDCFSVYQYYSGVIKRLNFLSCIPVFMHVGFVFCVPLSHTRLRLWLFFVVFQCFLLCLWLHFFIYCDVMNQSLMGLKKQSALYVRRPFLNQKKQAPRLLSQVMALKLPIVSLYFDTHQVVLIMQDDASSLMRLNHWLATVSNTRYRLEKNKSKRWVLDVVW